MNLNKIWRKAVGAALTLAMTGILLMSSNSAYAASNHVITTAEANHIIAHAERIQNKVQYHFGVNNPSKMWFDCSSFTKYLFGSEGIHLRWGARLQYADGIKIAKSQLRRGDLVFFSTPATYNRRTRYQKIGHVGIYIGHGRVIHDVDPKYDVLISNINRGYWKKHYVAAARVRGGHGYIAIAKFNHAVRGTGKVVRSVSFLTRPSLHAHRIRYLRNGEKFRIIIKVNRYWYKIKDHNGRIGYVTTLTKYIRV